MFLLAGDCNENLYKASKNARGGERGSASRYLRRRSPPMRFAGLLFSQPLCGHALAGKTLHR